MIRAHAEHPEAAAVAGCLVNATDATVVGRANFLAFAAAWQPPMPTLPGGRPPPASALSFKRDALEGIGSHEPGWLEGELIPSLFEEGLMAADDRIVVDHHQDHGGLWSLVNGFHSARCSYGRHRDGLTPAARRRLARLGDPRHSPPPLRGSAEGHGWDRGDTRGIGVGGTDHDRPRPGCDGRDAVRPRALGRPPGLGAPRPSALTLRLARRGWPPPTAARRFAAGAGPCPLGGGGFGRPVARRPSGRGRSGPGRARGPRGRPGHGRETAPPRRPSRDSHVRRWCRLGAADSTNRGGLQGRREGFPAAPGSPPGGAPDCPRRLGRARGSAAGALGQPDRPVAPGARAEDSRRPRPLGRPRRLAAGPSGLSSEAPTASSATQARAATAAAPAREAESAAAAPRAPPGSRRCEATASSASLAVARTTASRPP